MTASPRSVSVVIATYNRASCVGEAIESVLSQSSPAQQVIVVDDGSTDDTASVLASFGRSIEVVTQENQGVAAARNAGCARAKGEWLAFLDSDDIWTEDRLAILERDLATAPPEVVVHVGNVKLTGMGYAVTLSEERNLNLPTGRGIVFEDALDIAVSGLFTQASAIRKTAFDAIYGFDKQLTIHEDLKLFCQLSLAGPFLLTGDIVTSVRRMPNDDQALTSLERTRTEMARTCLVNAYGSLHDERMSDGQKARVARALSGALHSLAEAQWRSSKAEALKNLMRAAQVHPDRIKGYMKSILPLAIGTIGFKYSRRSSTGIDRS